MIKEAIATEVRCIEDILALNKLDLSGYVALFDGWIPAGDRFVKNGVKLKQECLPNYHARSGLINNAIRLLQGEERELYLDHLYDLVAQHKPEATDQEMEFFITIATDQTKCQAYLAARLSLEVEI